MLEKLNAQSTPIKAVIMLAIAGILVATAWYAYPGIGAMMEANNQEKAKLAKLTEDNNKMREYESKLSDLDRQIVMLKQQMELQKRIVPEEKDADKFIVLLQETASSAGINLRKLEAKAVGTKEFYSEVPFAIEVDGPYYSVLNFFERLAGQTRIVNVDGLAMKSLAKSTKFTYAPNDSVEVAATAKTFFSRESAPAEAGAPAPKK
ncbi:MAG TPA: type 4a pilus biogenesis protein PilO [Terriglobales bacterium]|nr:type 4a pilus biogenesis protein PilO [Terriglobales bacterium]